MRLSERACVFVSFILTFLSVSFFMPHISWGEEAKVLISEIQIKGETANDEFIELYNPNGFAVSLEGWSLKKKTLSGNESNILSDIGGEILPFGYLLIVPRKECDGGKCYLGATPEDKYYSTKNYLADDNTLLLYNKEKILVDKAGWGGASDCEGAIFSENPAAGQSLERRIFSGIMQDTDNNSADFSVQTNPSPRNSSYSDNDARLGEQNDGGGNDTSQEPEGPEDENGQDESGAGSEQGQEAVVPPSFSSDSSGVKTEKKVIVNELLINSEEDDGEMEFIEIYNAGRDEVDISGWSLEDKAGKVKSFIFPKSSKIAPGEYQVFYSSRTKISLNNTGDGALLRDSAGVKVSESPLSDEAKEEFAFALSGKQEWLWTALPTPGSKNIIKELPGKPVGSEKKPEEPGPEAESESEEEDGFEFDFSEEVSINEVLVNPSGEDNKEGGYEWVELFNSSGRDVNLRGWCLDDVLGKGSKAFCFKEDAIIAKGGYFIVSGKESKIFFNNNSDEVNLLWADGTVVDNVAYEKSKEDYSYSRNPNGSWFWTKDKTPLGKNAQLKSDAPARLPESGWKAEDSDWTEEEDEDDAGSVSGVSDVDRSAYEFFSISEAKRLPLKSRVVLDGIVSAPPGIFGKDVFYVSDKDSGEGLQIFAYGGKLPSFRLGDEVEVFGYMSQVGGEKRLVLASEDAAYKMSSDNLLQILPLSFDNLEDRLGSLVAIEGTAENISDRIFHLNAEGNIIKIYAKTGAGISFSGIKAHNRLRMSGILSRTSAGYRILPRFSSDMRFLERRDGGIMKTGYADEDIKGYNVFSYRNIFIILVLLVFSDWIRMRTVKKKRTI